MDGLARVPSPSRLTPPTPPRWPPLLSRGMHPSTPLSSPLIRPSPPHLVSPVPRSAPRLRNASYASPALHRPPPPSSSSPTLSATLSSSRRLRGSAFRLPDGSVMMSGGAEGNERSGGSPGSVSLMSNALQNTSMRQATYRLPDGSLVTRTEPNPQPSSFSPNLSSALLNPNMQQATDPDPAQHPQLGNALQNQNLRGASYRLPSSLEDPGGGRHAVVMPQVQGSGLGKGAGHHWAQGPGPGAGMGTQPGGPREQVDVWGSETVLPHPTVQNLTKWSMYRDEELLDPPGPLHHGQREMEDLEPDWAPNREGEPTGPWYDKMFFIRSLPSTAYREQREEDGVEDMTQLRELSERAVLLNLKKRFERRVVYTYIGSILVSVNPYRMFNMYGTDMVLKHKGSALGENPPHLFAIANVSYTTMMDAKQNQVIIISGESGSGKTEATKLLLRYLATIHHTHTVTQQILEAAPLLESFGNAKTVRNDNSSRFGKYVEIYLEEGVISGAITSQYLMEKSRIVFQAKDERNYHIFYEMLSGLPLQQRQAFYLQEAETYYYLNQGGDCGIAGKSDREDFLRLLVAMEILHFTPDDQASIFRVLSSILHLGNVYFQRHEADGQEVATVVSAQEIRVVAELLQISPEGLQKALTHKVTETMRDKIYTPLTVESAVDARDAVAKILYSLLFHWLTERINGQVYPRHHALSISVLDIYGFEDLSFNSFEQLCINYANEYLQFLFNGIVFRQEQEEYNREQIPWQDIPFNDNQACIDLISSKPHGVLRILDDQSCFPRRQTTPSSRSVIITMVTTRST
ncbi:unconventional myosin-XV [Salmo salar]|uniref:Unconventional myosin-XV n=1 Tax=Salmo salar TaxID=8030 RepID=A0ABM3EGG7_SALSA|nr:unconventional myosin-XV-like [Salmo salar]